MNPLGRSLFAYNHRPNRSEAHDRAILEARNRFRDDALRHKKLFARLDLLAEAIGDLDIEARVAEEIVQQVLQLNPVYIVERVGSYGMHRRHKEGRVVVGVLKPNSILPEVKPIL